MLVLLALNAAVSAGEIFVLRNGVTFGETREQVQAKETLAFQAPEKEGQTYLITEEGVVAGFDGVNIRYNFSDDGGLQEVIWYFTNYTSSGLDSLDNDYENLYAAFVRKYGAPLGNKDGEVFLVSGSAIRIADGSANLFKAFADGVGDIRDYDEWVVDCEDDKNTKIELASYYGGVTFEESFFSILISYDQFTDADLAKEVQDQQDSQQAIDDDI